MAQVKALQVSGENLKGYAAAVREKTLSCLQTLTPADLDRDLPAPNGGTRKAGDWLGILMIDHFHHSGQACYISRVGPGSADSRWPASCTGEWGAQKIRLYVLGRVASGLIRDEWLGHTSEHVAHPVSRQQSAKNRRFSLASVRPLYIMEPLFR